MLQRQPPDLLYSEPVSNFCDFFFGFVYSNIICAETRKTYRAVFSEPKVVIPNENVQASESAPALVAVVEPPLTRSEPAPAHTADPALTGPETTAAPTSETPQTQAKEAPKEPEKLSGKKRHREGDANLIKDDSQPEVDGGSRKRKKKAKNKGQQQQNKQ
jgi:ribonuclease P/MRP protein subunit RPP1